VVDLEQKGLVRLDDQGAVTHQALVPLPDRGPIRGAQQGRQGDRGLSTVTAVRGGYFPARAQSRRNGGGVPPGFCSSTWFTPSFPTSNASALALM
jgi:hypothetical protein